MTLRIGKKLKMLISIVLIIGISFLISISYEKYLDKNNLREIVEYKYDIIDRRAVNKELEKWINDTLNSSKNSGVSSMNDENNTYILIHSGRQTNEGTNIILYSVEQEKNNLNINYSINSDTNGKIVDEYDKVLILKGSKGEYKINDKNIKGAN